MGGNDFGNFEGDTHHQRHEGKTTLVTSRAAHTTWAWGEDDFGNFEGDTHHQMQGGNAILVISKDAQTILAWREIRLW